MLRWQTSMIIVWEELKKQLYSKKRLSLCGCHQSIVCAHLFWESQFLIVWGIDSGCDGDVGNNNNVTAINAKSLSFCSSSCLKTRPWDEHNLPFAEPISYNTIHHSTSNCLWKKDFYSGPPITFLHTTDSIYHVFTNWQKNTNSMGLKPRHFFCLATDNI